MIRSWFTVNTYAIAYSVREIRDGIHLRFFISNFRGSRHIDSASRNSKPSSWSEAYPKPRDISSCPHTLFVGFIFLLLRICLSCILDPNVQVISVQPFGVYQQNQMTRNITDMADVNKDKVKQVAVSPKASDHSQP